MACALGLHDYSRSKSERGPLRVDQTGSLPRAIRVLVVDRRDAKSRFLKNHPELMRALHTGLPKPFEIKEFVGSTMPFAAQIKAFAWADVVIAPHGAALGLCVYMRPGGAVVEIGYPKRELPLIFMATALSAQLEYFMTISKVSGSVGEYTATTFHDFLRLPTTSYDCLHLLVSPARVSTH